MSALVPEVGDRYRLREDEWQVVKLNAQHHGPPAAKLRQGAIGGPHKVVKIEALLFGAWVYLGNFLPPPGFKAIKVGPHWYFKTPAGNVHGAPAGVRWTEADVLREARAAAAADLSARGSRA